VLIVGCHTTGFFVTTNCSLVMWSRRSSYNQAFKTLHDGISRWLYLLDKFLTLYSALPLFNPTENFTKLLELYAACNCSPSSDHPALQDWLGIGYQVTPSQSSGFPTSPTRRTLGTILPAPLSKQHSKAEGQASPLSSLRPMTLDG
jgi:hypothetical protein